MFFAFELRSSPSALLGAERWPLRGWLGRGALPTRINRSGSPSKNRDRSSVIAQFFIRLCKIEQLSGQSSCTLEILSERGRTMVLPLPPSFPHRRNGDSSFDSICLKCLLTIATARTEVELARYEKYHVCNPSILSQRAFDGAHEKSGCST